MNLSEYFENVKGTGILATGDSDGNIDAALYGKPFFVDERTIAFDMMHRVSYANLQTNPNACYMFIEKAEGFIGKRLNLVKEGEETDAGKIRLLKKKYNLMDIKGEEQRHIVYFRIKEIRPLVIDGE